MDKDLISVIIPVYNTGESALKLIDIILNSEHRNLEVIIINDGSKDNSLELLKSINDKRVKIYTKENGGASSARNFGIKKSAGSFLVFLDSDDSVSKNFIAELYNGIKENDEYKLAVTSVKYCRVKTNESRAVYMKNIKRGKKESLKTYILKMLVIDGRIYSSTNKIYYADIIRDKKILFDEKRDFAEDTQFVLKYLKATGECKVKLILKPLYHYNFGTITSTVKNTSTKWINWDKSYKDVLDWVGKNPTIEEKILLKLLKLRWRISYYRSCRRSR